MSNTDDNVFILTFKCHTSILKEITDYIIDHDIKLRRIIADTEELTISITLPQSIEDRAETTSYFESIGVTDSSINTEPHAPRYYEEDYLPTTY